MKPPNPHWQNDNCTLFLGDCREVMRRMPENSVDTIITDPPYHLTSGNMSVDCGSFVSKKGATNQAGRNHPDGGFMGQSWDGGDVAFQPATWRAVLRVAKPGAFLLCFGGTRTWHRLACAIEDAGWQIRDNLLLLWCYGTGFPKSLDISKAIDKAAGATRKRVVNPRWADKYPNGPGGNKTGDGRAATISQLKSISGNPLEMTLPATDAVKLWNGWGTSLKPAWEPIIVAMRPLDGTFAQNARKWVVSGLNIDGCRIPVKGEKVPTPQSDPAMRLGVVGKDLGISRSSKERMRAAQFESAERTNTNGRWPANLILDDGAAEMLNQQAGIRTFNSGTLKAGFRKNGDVYGKYKFVPATGRSDSGGASRFFYTAKSSRSEREGSTHPTMKPLSLMKWLCKLTATPTGGIVLDPFCGSGSTLLAARRTLNRKCIGIDQSEEYLKISVRRLERAIKKDKSGLIDARRWQKKAGD